MIMIKKLRHSNVKPEVTPCKGKHLDSNLRVVISYTSTVYVVATSHMWLFKFKLYLKNKNVAPQLH